MSLRTVVAALVLVLVPLSAGFVVLATHEAGWCAQTVETITLGAGPLPAAVPPLHGVLYLDLPHPPCSSGRHWIDHESDPIQTEQHCDEGFVRVFGGAGETSVEFIINWQPTGQGCA